jgi:hypothetical protein
LACAVFLVFPELAEQTAVYQSIESDGLSLHLELSSPSGDADRTLILYIDEQVGPTFSFGPGHCHDDMDGGFTEIVDLIGAILDDQFVIIEEIGGPYDGHAEWFDLREPDALEDYLTHPDHSGRVRLKSWSGRADREVSIDTL